MSSSFRLIRFGQNLVKPRWPAIQGYSTVRPLAPPNIIKPAIQFRAVTTTPPKPDGDQKNKDPLPEIKFKNLDVKKVFKQFYSLYGPLFVGCHIGISLCSLGFFYSLVWFTVDPMSYLPEGLISSITDRMHTMGNSGGKFVIAYAIHKVVLPIRLTLAILLTRILSRTFKLKYQKKKSD